MNGDSDVCGCRECICGPQAAFFAALGNESRLSLVLALRETDKNVGELAEELGLEQSAASHALKQLNEAGIVRSQKEGKYRVYSLNRDLMDKLLSSVEPHVAQHDALKRMHSGGSHA